ncbi:DUF3021 family protein [Staphylococcus aureus]
MEILFTYGNLIFTDTDWSITKQTVVHFILMILILPTRYSSRLVPSETSRRLLVSS